jgi:uncharacterized protein (DUF608 family)
MRRYHAILLWATLGLGLLATNAEAGEPAVQQYTAVVAAEPDLVAYWRLEGNLKDAKGSLDARMERGGPQFGEGPGGGQALVLENHRFLSVGDTPSLDLKETTLELWFKPTYAKLGYNPCIVAKRAAGDHTHTRFSVHIWGDYSGLALWNGHQVTRYQVGGGSLKCGEWYHLAVTGGADGVQFYVNGVLCDAEPSLGALNLNECNLPLQIGASTPGGQEALACMLDEAAVYRRALSEEQIAAHVDAMGWKEQRLQMVRARQTRLEEARKQAEQLQIRRDRRRAELLADPVLMSRGGPFVYRGEHLAAISMPVGAIGGGSIQINGNAERPIWQIFNNFQGVTLPDSFFAVRVADGSGPPTVRALQTTPVGPFAAMKALSFRGEYPFGWHQFEDGSVPVRLSLETFSPLVPLEAVTSAMPCAIFNLTAENPTNRPIEVSFLAAQQNAVGYLDDKPVAGRVYPGYGGNRCEVRKAPGAAILHMTSDKSPDAPGAGDMALVAAAEDATGAASWESLEQLAAAIGEKGALTGPERAGPSPAGQTLDGALCVRFTLPPGGKRTVPFLLTWYFPKGKHGGGQWGDPGNMYAAVWPSALGVAEELLKNLPELTRKTRLYHDSLYASNLPHWLLDRISSQVAILRTPTCFWTDDGYFGGWEGCGRGGGCCHGNCNHVWHYAQAHARLFPTIARTMRQQEFTCQAADGGIPHRQPKSFPAFDGQCGAVLNSYREHLMSPDRQWLDKHWPSIKRAMDYAIVTWDKDGDGVLGGPQWNTLDGALGGSSSWLGTMYLAALAAAERMAALENEPDTAKRYAAIRVSGSKKQDETLFNGEYYIQIPDPEPREDYAGGCHIDQVLGQWWAHQLDLGWLYPPDRVRTALSSLFKYNFRGTMVGLKQAPRKFVADDDPAMQMIIWPKGGRPAKCILYGDEVMTGFEYSAAAAMIQAGLLREGFTVVRAIGIRYDGRLRTGLTNADSANWGYSGNPFGDDECGKFYARAMSVWSLLLACQGYVYDGPAGRIGFKPVWQPEDHTSFFTAAEGWGVLSQRRSAQTQTERIEVRYGKLRVNSLVFQVAENTQPRKTAVQLAGKNLPAKSEIKNGEVQIVLEQPVTVETGSALTVVIDLAGK